MDRVSPEPNTGCWLWVGTLNQRGYARVGRGNQTRRGAYRLAYELFKGPIPNGAEIDHLCRVRCCVNPDHLEAVSHQVNSQRATNAQALKQACLRGHLFNTENTYIVVRKDGQRCRYCRACAKIREAGYQARNKHVTP